MVEHLTLPAAELTINIALGAGLLIINLSSEGEGRLNQERYLSLLIQSSLMFPISSVAAFPLIVYT